MRVLIVDDEPLARVRIHDLLRLEGDVEAVSECGHGEAAVALIQRGLFDVVFLDVQMPGLDGFGVLEQLSPESTPVVIFVTAYEQYAVRAFDVQALDYLLKPFEASRFAAALARARAEIARDGGTHAKHAARALVSERLNILAARSGERIIPVRTNDIDWIEAEGNYVRLHVGRSSHLVRQTVARLEAALDASSFRRIHRSTIVNVQRIRELTRWFRHDYKVILRDGTELALGRRYRDRLADFLGRA